MGCKPQNGGGSVDPARLGNEADRIKGHLRGPGEIVNTFSAQLPLQRAITKHEDAQRHQQMLPDIVVHG